MPKKGEKEEPMPEKAKINPETGEEEITIDMTQARVLEPLDPRRPYLMSVSAWKPGKSGSGGRKLHYELTVAEPTDSANRKVMEDVSLDNEFTLGRLLQVLTAIGFPEEDVKTKNFKLPSEDDVLGLQCTVWVRTQTSEVYGDRSRIRRLRPASVYSEVATA
jgi:hypothetical protein